MFWTKSVPHQKDVFRGRAVKDEGICGWVSPLRSSQRMCCYEVGGAWFEKVGRGLLGVPVEGVCLSLALLVSLLPRLSSPLPLYPSNTFFWSQPTMHRNHKLK